MMKGKRRSIKVMFGLEAKLLNLGKVWKFPSNHSRLADSIGRYYDILPKEFPGCRLVHVTTPSRWEEASERFRILSNQYSADNSISLLDIIKLNILHHMKIWIRHCIKRSLSGKLVIYLLNTILIRKKFNVEHFHLRDLQHETKKKLLYFSSTLGNSFMSNSWDSATLIREKVDSPCKFLGSSKVCPGWMSVPSIDPTVT